MGKLDDLVEGKKQNYYMNLIQKMVEDQKEFLGDEIALKQARRAPLQIDENGNVNGFYGSGETALNTLRSYTENQEFYLDAIKMIVDRFKEFAGEKIALIAARQSPLEVSSKGEIRAYYGTGKKALNILIDQYRKLLGERLANIEIRQALQDISEKNKNLVPPDVRPGVEGKSHVEYFLDRLKSVFGIDKASGEPG
ncbi:MAG: hypothetical protein SVV03_06620 [Candidatus Nanohaloarchaea archaeon]|nr:hypothetical protein [Candidatus Nanohaloarchaea archaeon]